MKNNCLAFYLIGVFFFAFLSGNAQKENGKFGVQTHSLGVVKFVDNVFGNQSLSNRVGAAMNLRGDFRKNKKLFLEVSIIYSNADLNQAIEIEKNAYAKADNFHFNTSAILLGYKYKKFKSIDFNVYSGLLLNEYVLKKNGTGANIYRSKLGVPVGLELMWKKETKKEKGSFYNIYVRNSINYSGLKRAHNSFSNFYYAYEVGLGYSKKIEPSEPKKKKKKKRRKKGRRKRRW